MTMIGLLRTAALGLALMGAAAPLPAVSATYGLVIGVDEYTTQRNLMGAVNDANHIERALTTFGARDVKVFRNGEAKRADIEAAWKNLLSQAGRGDTIVLTISAHGAQEKDHDGDEASADQPFDVHDEVVLLGRFDPNHLQHVNERLRDDDLHEWFLDAEARGIRVIFVADTCYSGTLTRSVGRVSSRVADPYHLAKPPKKQRKEKTLSDNEVPSNVVFISGGREAEIVIEVAIDGLMRGATSHAFAKALEGAADTNGDGIWTRNELAEYVTVVAHQRTTQHSPSFRPRSGADFPVLVKDNARPKPAVPVGVVNPVRPPKLPGRVLATGGNDIYWNPLTRKLMNRAGDTLGYDIPEWMLPALTNKFRLVELVKDAAAENPVPVAMRRGGERIDRVHREGEQLNLAIGPIRAPYVTIFNLTNEGWVQPVFPKPGDYWETGPQPVLEEMPSFPVNVKGPFGADHVVAVVTRNRPEHLRRALEGRRADPATLLPILKDLIGTGAHGFGLHAFFTEEAK